MLVLFDQGFFVLHTLLIIFNMVGWIWRRTRLLHLLTMGLTAFSWFVLGAYYGWGYCLCTDWHFKVRHTLGYHDLDSSYLQLLARHWVGMELTQTQSDWLGGSVFTLIVLAMIVVWVGEWRRWRKRRFTFRAPAARET